MSDKQSLYESLLRNQIYSPKLKEQIMTIIFMKGCIGYNKYWLPKCSELRIINCVDPPTRSVLAEMVSS